jgi:curved DNA-binding protein CbpA
LSDSKGYYALLGVSEKATYQEIKRSYRRLARKYHPDKNHSLQAEEIIKKINAAFEVLSDHHKRAEYDRTGMAILNDDFKYQPQSGSEKYGEDSELHSAPTETSSGRAQARTRTARARATSQQTQEQPYFGPTHIESPKGRFHIIVEPSLCMAFGSCETLAPKVFVVEKNRRVNPKAVVECETCESFEKVYAAAQTCPTKAIRIVDRYTGEQIFP